MMKTSSSLPHTPKMLKRHAASSLLLCLLALLPACSGMGVYDDLEECPRGVVMRFVFDYNLEYANSFPNQVDCLTVYLFDSDGNLVERRTETSDVLKDENWRMTFDLPAGDYQVVAYGGMACGETSFSHTRKPEEIQKITDLDALMHEEYTGDEADRPAHPLHDLYHGIHTFTVTEGTAYDSTTVHMMRDTNNIRLVLQHLDNTPVDDKDFRFEIIDDNTHLDYKNDLVARRTVTYTPWITGTANAGLGGLPADAPQKAAQASEPQPVQVAFADISVSRLIHDSSFIWEADGKTQRGPRLRIISKEYGRVVADLPLNNYLLLLKGEHLGKMGSQEFLDRANNFSLVFFLDHNHAWIRMNIIVDDWTVRVNNIDDFQ